MLLKTTILRYLLYLSLILLFLPRLYSQTKVINNALKYVGIIEEGNNRGPEIEKWQSNVNIPKGSPYCAAYASYVLDESDVTLPRIRSGLAIKFITKNSIRAIDVYKGKIKLEGDYLVIWKHGSTWRGHVGFKLVWKNKKGYVIEGNTKFKGKEGVFIRYREIKPYSYFRIINFTRIICGKKLSWRQYSVWY